MENQEALAIYHLVQVTHVLLGIIMALAGLISLFELYNKKVAKKQLSSWIILMLFPVISLSIIFQTGFLTYFRLLIGTVNELHGNSFVLMISLILSILAAVILYNKNNMVIQKFTNVLLSIIFLFIAYHLLFHHQYVSTGIIEVGHTHKYVIFAAGLFFVAGTSHFAANFLDRRGKAFTICKTIWCASLFMGALLFISVPAKFSNTLQFNQPLDSSPTQPIKLDY